MEKNVYQLCGVFVLRKENKSSIIKTHLKQDILIICLSEIPKYFKLKFKFYHYVNFFLSYLGLPACLDPLYESLQEKCDVNKLLQNYAHFKLPFYVSLYLNFRLATKTLKR